MIMMKGPAILILIFLKSSINAQMDSDMGDYDAESGSEWSPKQFLISLTQMCHNDCSQKCLSDCPQPKLCKDDQVACGKKALANGEWLDCPKDDICVPKGCECKNKQLVRFAVFHKPNLHAYIDYNIQTDCLTF